VRLATLTLEIGFGVARMALECKQSRRGWRAHHAPGTKRWCRGQQDRLYAGGHPLFPSAFGIGAMKRLAVVVCALLFSLGCAADGDQEK
jgi:hypothetical protein